MPLESGTSVALIVEDNEDVRDIYISELNRMGWEAVTALLESDIIESIQEYQFDVALLDSHFPGISLDRLKTLVQGIPHLVVALDDTVSGPNVIQKPFMLNDLRRMIEDVVAREAKGFREGDIVRSKSTPSLPLGIVLAVEEDRVYVRFSGVQESHGAQAKADAAKPIWCHETALHRVSRKI